MSGARTRMTRGEVRSLLSHYGRARDGHVPDDVVNAWTRALAAYSAGECHAALSSMTPAAIRSVTAAEIGGRIDAARDRAASVGAHRHAPDPAAERTRYAAAGTRGIHAVYAAMGWQRVPEWDHARAVRCPFCRAAPHVLCSPLSRDRHGRRELRDPRSRMHPSRHAAAHHRADTTRPSTPLEATR